MFIFKFIRLIHISTTVRCLTATHNTFFAKFTIELIIVRQLFAKVNVSPCYYTNMLNIKWISCWYETVYLSPIDSDNFRHTIWPAAMIDKSSPTTVHSCIDNKFVVNSKPSFILEKNQVLKDLHIGANAPWVVVLFAFIAQFSADNFTSVLNNQLAKFIGTSSK